MPSSITDVFNSIVSDVAAAQKDEGEKLAEILREKVSVPVEYETGPRGGVRIIRSKPGEPPRKETGALQTSIESETIEVGDEVATAVTVSVPYAIPLQESLDRPITDTELEAIQGEILDRLAAAIDG